VATPPELFGTGQARDTAFHRHCPVDELWLEKADLSGDGIMAEANRP
jgi:hypothetical protein